MTTVASPSTLPAAVVPPSRLHSVSVVLPCLDEAGSIAGAVRDASAVAARLSEDHEIIVVDDGSRDASGRIVAGLAAADPGVRLLVHARNRGYGDALRSGIAAARMEWVLLMDADGQFDVADLERFVGLTAGADVVWGRRIVRRDTLRRRAAAAAWNRLVRTLLRLPVGDIDCGFKLIRRELLHGLGLEAGGAMISTELAVRCAAAGGRFAEVGVRHHPRLAGRETGGDPRVILRAFRELARMSGALRRLSRDSHERSLRGR